jgi:signal peptidase II
LSTTAPASQRTNEGSWLPVGLIAALVVALLDQASKFWLLHAFDLESRGRVKVAPFFDFVLTWNRGISYGLLQQDTALGQWLLLGVKLAAVGLLGYWLLRASSMLVALALGLIIGGALGNGVDRLLYGAVVDFVLFHVPRGGSEFRWYVFNLADAAIVAGVVGLLYDSFRPVRAAKAP